VSQLKLLLSPKQFLIGFGLLTALVLVIAASTSTAAFGVYNSAWDGATELQDVAATTGASTTIARETTHYTQTTPNETVSVILSPDQEYTEAEHQRLESFVDNGGTLIIADDYGSTANRLLAALETEARVDGRPLRDEQFNYRSPAMPVANNVTNHSTVANVSALTLNHGTAVTPQNASVLVRTSEYAYLDTNQNGTLDENEQVRSYPVATTEQRGQGTVIVVGDPSLFINTMLAQSDNRVFVRTLFARHSDVVLDYSHTATLPPLAVALLVVRNSALLQFAGGALGTLAVFAILRTNIGTRLKRTVTPAGSQHDRIEATESELSAYLRNRHPEWDDDRIQRVVAARQPEINANDSTE